MQLDILKSHTQASIQFAADNDIRYYLNSVYIETGPRGALLIATNGHILSVARIHAEPLPESNIIIPRSMVEKIKAPKKGNPCVTLTYDDTGEKREITLKDGDSQVSMIEVDGKYPDWRRVIPDSLTGETACYDFKYLACCQKAAEILGNRYCAILHNGNSPGVVDFSNDGFMAIVMPMRGNTDAKGWAVPEWTGKTPIEKPSLQMVA